MLWEIYLEKGCWVPIPHSYTLLLAMGFWEVIDSHVDLEEFKSFGSFGGLGYVNALAITKHTFASMIFHPHC
jgi:hypothetical protein